jgi:hypothetical protein
MPDLSDAIIDSYPTCHCSVVGNNYETLKWSPNNTIPKPTLAELNIIIARLTLEAPMKQLRQQRNQKLEESDKYVIPDWPHTNDTVRQSWLTYRQSLRNLPSTSNPSIDSNYNLTGFTWPTPPS